jgi:hypothetical protein
MLLWESRGLVFIYMPILICYPVLIVLAQNYIVHGIKIILVTIQTDYLDEGFSNQGSCLKLGS